MRSLQTLGLACITAISGAAMAIADETMGPSPHRQSEVTYLVMAHAPPGIWQDNALVLRQDRLKYLNGALCLEHRGCSTALASAEAVDQLERDYIDALNLGSYGPMKVKFTGDRVKLKVRF